MRLIIFSLLLCFTNIAEAQIRFDNSNCCTKLETVTDTLITGFASGLMEGGVITKQRNCTIINTQLGRYQVIFSVPYPEGEAYEVLFGVQEDLNLDIPKASVLKGSQTSAGFIINTTGDDNGAGADFPDEEPVSFEVLYSKIIKTIK